MIPLRDDNPATLTPVVMVALIASCVFFYAANLA